jgi:hypothetical protein
VDKRRDNAERLARLVGQTSAHFKKPNKTSVQRPMRSLLLNFPPKEAVSKESTIRVVDNHSMSTDFSVGGERLAATMPAKIPTATNETDTTLLRISSTRANLKSSHNHLLLV